MRGPGRTAFSAAVLAFLAVVTVPGLATAQGKITGKITATGVRKPDNIVIYLKSVPGNHPPPATPAIMDQKDFVFIPHVLPVVRGTTVRFLNSEPKAQHNIFSPDKVADRMNLGTYPPGEVRDHVFDKECSGTGTCVAAMLCNVHPEMSAYVVILQNPYFAVTGRSGTFEIRNVPAGTYELVAWHEKLKETAVKVTVGSGDVQVDLKMSK
jgi:plastocyanin